MLDIRKERTKTPKTKPDYNNLGFGRYFTDHMFLMNYEEGKGWHDARIVPYAPFELEPSCMVFHYAQEMFEGLKAYMTSDGKIQLFRPDKNIERMHNTNERLCIPQIPNEDVLQAITETVLFDRDWIPTKVGTSLYIRPFIIATDPHLGVHPSHTYVFCIILSPVAAYYAEGINPVKIFIEHDYVRAVKGGTGFAKVGGNYASSLKGQEKAAKLGYSQVLWLDGIYRKYIDEVGAMNVFFVIGDEVVTPSLSEGSILPGVTRASCIELLKSKGYKVSERKISVDELYEAYDRGELKEAFGTGTAAVISPIGSLDDENKKALINNGEIGPISQMLYDTLTGIQWGNLPDPFGWIKVIG
jgi:branched-chain amino acid aminotransferase